MNPLLAPAVFGEKRGVEPGVKQSSLERQGKVYTEIVPDVSKKPLQAVIRGPGLSRASSTRMAGGATMGFGGYGLSEASPRPSVTNKACVAL